MDSVIRFAKDLIDLSNDHSVTGRFPGLCRGLCLSNEDPDHLGRIKVYIPVLHGPKSPDPSSLRWTNPCSGFGGASESGSVLVPDPGMGVWVAFEHGDLQYPIWLGAWWAKPGSTEVPVKAYQSGSAPSHHILYRYGTMVVSAAKDSSKIRIDLNDNTWLEFDKDNRVHVQVSDDCFVNCDNSPEKVTITAKGGTVTIEDSKIHAVESGGSDVVMDNGDITLTDSASDFIKMSEGEIKIKAPSIIIEGQVLYGTE